MRPLIGGRILVPATSALGPLLARVTVLNARANVFVLRDASFLRRFLAALVLPQSLGDMRIGAPAVAEGHDPECGFLQHLDIVAVFAGHR